MIDPIIREVRFIQSETDWHKCPAGDLPEYAFIGRSNVGKSSLINKLVGNKSMAKTSGKPGKTQTINHFLVNNSWYIVDLPGYGYASISKSMREKWAKMIDAYLNYREQLQIVFVLIDIRLKPQPIDIAFINRMGEMNIPFAMVFTKSDKVSKKAAIDNSTAFCNTLMETWDALPPYFITSAETAEGKEALLQYITEINELYYQNKQK